MQSSVFNLRVPLPSRGDVFLMNTLTDAQLIVSPDVATLLDRLDGRASFDALTGDDRETAALLVENGFLVPDRQADHLALDRYFTSVTTDSSELHITVLTTLQCNFACDYCFQGDHGDSQQVRREDVAGHRGADGGVGRARDGSRVTGARDADVLRRGAAAQPAGDVLPGGAAAPRGRRPGPRPRHQHHHQRPAAHAGDRRPPPPLRAARREDHARRRPRHPQPDAAAARRTGHVRSHRGEHPRGRRSGGGGDRRQFRRSDRRQLTRRCSIT